jgi:hypothetical protein
MKKLFAVIVAIALVASFASAQDVWGQGKMSAGIGAEAALPMGTFGDVVGIGIGGFGLFQYGINEDILGTAQVGYTSFMEKDNSGVKSSCTALTILVGGKYSLKTVTPGMYCLAQLGIYSQTYKSSYSYTFWGTTVSGTAELSESKFIVAPGIGYQVEPVDISVKYVINGDFSNLALNIAYVMPL